MPDPGARWRPSPTFMMAGAIPLLGFWLTGVSWWFLILVVVGLLGPGILREWGLLHDQDEFQRRAAYRAGYHAFLVTALLAAIVEARVRTGQVQEHPERLPGFFLALLGFTWLLSSLFGYWGPRKAATRILIAFGALWFAFTVLSNTGPEWTGWTSLLLHPLLTLPFFGLAWLSRQRPRLAGVLLLGSAAGLFRFFGWHQEGAARLLTDDTFLLFLGPLLACGVALLAAGRPDEEEGDEREVLVSGR